MVINKPYIRLDGSQAWRINKLLHRENDLPAIIYADGTQEWYINEKRHRENDLPAIINADGYQAWFINGQRHRLYAPAIINYNKEKYRLYLAPAVITSDKKEYWFIDDNDITEQVLKFIEEYGLPHWSEWTDQHKILFRMKF